MDVVLLGALSAVPGDGDSVLVGPVQLQALGGLRSLDVGVGDVGLHRVTQPRGRPGLAGLGEGIVVAEAALHRLVGVPRSGDSLQLGPGLLASWGTVDRVFGSAFHLIPAERDLRRVHIDLGGLQARGWGDLGDEQPVEPAVVARGHSETAAVDRHVSPMLGVLPRIARVQRSLVLPVQRDRGVVGGLLIPGDHRDVIVAVGKVHLELIVPADGEVAPHVIILGLFAVAAVHRAGEAVAGRGVIDILGADADVPFCHRALLAAEVEGEHLPWAHFGRAPIRCCGGRGGGQGRHQKAPGQSGRSGHSG